ncbi:MAG: hypothetical protein ACRDOK_29590, partial [Streptosporangiaceae bacterium]
TEVTTVAPALRWAWLGTVGYREALALQRTIAVARRSGELDDDALLLLDPVTGDPVAAVAIPLHLRRARVTAVSIEANASICLGMLRHRYGPADEHS